MNFSETPDVVRSALSLVKHNDGLFKSAKQGEFLRKTFKLDFNDFQPTYAGITEEGDFFSWTGYVSWADYGARSTRPYGWVFKYDEFGIVKQWKLKWKGDMRSGTSIDAKGTKLVFERSADVDTSELAAQYEAASVPAVDEPTSEYVGNVGDKIEADLEVTHTFVTNSYYGSSLLIGMQDDKGNKFVWFSTAMPEVHKGDKVHIKGRIKDHGEFRGSKQTTLTRCKLS
jgi:hypothetical protein